MSYVTPYLPDSAEAEVRKHQREKKFPVFVKAYEHCNDARVRLPACPNCAGVGVVCLQFADGGPYSTVTTSSKVVAWFEGDGKFRKGFYTIDRTEVFECPECHGQPVEPGAPVAPDRVAEMMTEVAGNGHHQGGFLGGRWGLPASDPNRPGSKQAGKR